MLQYITTLLSCCYAFLAIKVTVYQYALLCDNAAMHMTRMGHMRSTVSSMVRLMPDSPIVRCAAAYLQRMSITSKDLKLCFFTLLCLKLYLYLTYWFGLVKQYHTMVHGAVKAYTGEISQKGLSYPALSFEQTQNSGASYVGCCLHESLSQKKCVNIKSLLLIAMMIQLTLLDV